MSLINPDIDWLIASFIFDRPRRSSHELLKKVMFAFGRSMHDFIRVCQDYFYKKSFRQHGVSCLEDLLKKLLNKKSVKNFPCYQELTENQGESHLFFERLNAKHRLVIYYTSLYHGYIYVASNTEMTDTPGFEYDNFHDEHPGEVFPYSLLKRKRIHNLDYYEVVEKGPTPETSTFRLKPDAQIYKRGVTKEWKDIECIRII